LDKPERGVGGSGELPEPDDEEDMEAERLRMVDEGLILIGSDCFADLFESTLLKFVKDIFLRVCGV
jgi:hypothetical protein